MTLLSILEFPDPRLRTRAAAVDPAGIADPAFQTRLDDMFQTMYEAPGIGLAASQVDDHRRFMVIDTSEEKNEPRVSLRPPPMRAAPGSMSPWRSRIQTEAGPVRQKVALSRSPGSAGRAARQLPWARSRNSPRPAGKPGVPSGWRAKAREPFHVAAAAR